MKNKLLIAILILGFTINLQAQNCDPIFAQVVSSGVADDIYKAYKKMREDVADLFMGKKAGSAASSAIELQETVVGSIGKLLKMGPKQLMYDVKSKCKDMGRLQGEGAGLIGGNRQFIVPIAGYDRTIVTVKKTDGKAGANIAVCVQNEIGNTFNKKDKSIGKGQETIGNEARLVFYNTADKFLFINISKTDGFNDFEYTIEVHGEFNEEVIIRDHGQAKESQSSTPKDKRVDVNNYLQSDSDPVITNKTNQFRNEPERNFFKSEESKTYTKEEVDQHLLEKEKVQQEAAAAREAEKTARQQKREEVEQQAVEDTKNKAKERKEARSNQQDQKDARSQQAKDRAKDKAQERKQDRPGQQTKEEQIKERAKDRKQKRDEN